MRKVYPSDISREQFDQVKELLETARKETRPRTIILPCGAPSVKTGLACWSGH